MRGTNAWMLRRDGKAFPVQVHIYADIDDDLSSAAEAAAFLIATDSAENISPYKVLDAWAAMLIENEAGYDDTDAELEQHIKDAISDLPYHLSYPISTDQLIAIHQDLNSYHTTWELYNYLDDVRQTIEVEVKDVIHSLNQQFCRVRFGGQYDTNAGNSTLWFRISSEGYNWVNTIYLFTAENYRRLGVNYITICRDYESDYGDQSGMPEYIYKAKDGVPYFNMPIDEYLAEEHEHSPVFSSKMTKQQEIKQSCVELSSILCAEFSDSAKVHSRKLIPVASEFLAMFPEVDGVDFDLESRDNSKGNPVGFELFMTLHSKHPEIDGIELSTKLSRPIAQVPSSILFRNFRIDWLSYKKYKNIKF